MNYRIEDHVPAVQDCMQRLMQYIHGNALPTAYVSLMADHGTPEFYRRYGFEPSLLPRKAGMSLRIV